MLFAVLLDDLRPRLVRIWIGLGLEAQEQCDKHAQGADDKQPKADRLLLVAQDRHDAVLERHLGFGQQAITGDQGDDAKQSQANPHGHAFQLL